MDTIKKRRRRTKKPMTYNLIHNGPRKHHTELSHKLRGHNIKTQYYGQQNFKKKKKDSCLKETKWSTKHRTEKRNIHAFQTQPKTSNDVSLCFNTFVLFNHFPASSLIYT